jgi:hypothetical protein
MSNIESFYISEYLVHIDFFHRLSLEPSYLYCKVLLCIHVIYGLFNDATNSLDLIALNDKMINK